METLEYPNLQLEIDGPLAVLVLNDPERLNAMNSTMVESILHALQEVSKPRRKIRCLMITGAGRGFCAGANMARRLDKADDQPRNLPPIGFVESLFHPMIRKVRDLSIPVVAAVNGPCVGIGLSLTMLSDFAVAAQSSFFLVPFRNLASAPDSALTWLLPRVVGLTRARKILMGAERFSAEKALEWGLVQEIYPDDSFKADARTLAQGLAEGPTIALGAMRRLLFDSLGQGLDAQMEDEARAVLVTSRTKDNVAAVKAFGSKTKVIFTGE